MRLPFVPLQLLRRRKVQREQVARLIEQIEGLEHGLESSRVRGGTPAAYGAAQRLRGSLLEEELAGKRGELEGLRARLRSTEVRPARPEPGGEIASEGSISVAPSPHSYLEPGRLRARIVLSSLAAVAVLLGVAKLPMEHTAEVQAYGAASEPAGFAGGLPAPSPDHVAVSAGPLPQAQLAARASEKPLDPGLPAGGISLPAVDYFEGWGTSAPAIKTASALAEDPARVEVAEETTTPGTSDEIVAEAVAERAPVAVVTLAAVRLRERPATTARTLRSVAAGSRLAVVGASASGWTHVETRDGTVGWIIASALRPV